MNTWKKVAALLLALALALCLTSCDMVQSAIGGIGKQDPSTAGNKPAGDHSGDTDPGPGQGGQDQPGTAASSVAWSLSGGVLTFSGNGPMEDIDLGNGVNAQWDSTERPWTKDESTRLSITTVVIEPGITTIGNYAFDRCANLSSVSIPDSVTVIGRCAFGGCDSLTSITVPDSITGNLEETFTHCHNLKTATIGTNVEMVNSTFYNCPALESLTFRGSNTDTFQGYLPLYCADPAANRAQEANIVIYAPAGSPIEAACKTQGYNFSALN